MSKKWPKIHIRQISDNKIVHSIPMLSTYPGHVDRVVAGLLKRIDTDNYIVDDSELDGD